MGLMKRSPLQALVLLALLLPVSAQDLLWSGSGTGIIEEISFFRSAAAADGGDPELGSALDYEYFFLGSQPSGASTSSLASYGENIYVSDSAGYGQVSPLLGAVGNHAFSTGYPSFAGVTGTLQIVNDLVFDTSSLLSAFDSESGLLGVPSQLTGDSIIFSDDYDYSRVSTTYYSHTLLILNDASGTAFAAAFFNADLYDFSKFTTAKLYHESVSGDPTGINYDLSFVADLKCIPEPSTLLLLALGALPMARRKRPGF